MKSEKAKPGVLNIEIMTEPQVIILKGAEAPKFYRILL